MAARIAAVTVCCGVQVICIDFVPPYLLRSQDDVVEGDGGARAADILSFDREFERVVAGRGKSKIP